MIAALGLMIATQVGEVDQRDWLFLTDAANGTLVYVLPYQGRGASYPRMWVRYEIPEGVMNIRARSIRMLNEYDCQQWRSRMISTVQFARPNLDGESHTIGEGRWEYVGPDSLAQVEIETICGATSAE